MNQIYSSDLRTNFTLKHYLFRAVKLTKNPDPGIILILDMVIDLIQNHFFQFQISILVIMFFWCGLQCMLIKEKNSLNPGKGTIKILEDIKVIAEFKYSINFAASKINFV